MLPSIARSKSFATFSARLKGVIFSSALRLLQKYRVLHFYSIALFLFGFVFLAVRKEGAINLPAFIISA